MSDPTPDPTPAAPFVSPLPGEDVTDIDGPEQDVDQAPVIDTTPEA